MISLADITTQMNICKTLALAFPRFYKKTQISAQMNFIYSHQNSSIEISLGFYRPEATTPEAKMKEPSDEEYSILFEEIVNAEKLLMNENLINSAYGFENIKQFIFKHKEDMRQIIDKQKEDDHKQNEAKKTL